MNNTHTPADSYAPRHDGFKASPLYHCQVCGLCYRQDRLYCVSCKTPSGVDSDEAAVAWVGDHWIEIENLAVRVRPFIKRQAHEQYVQDARNSIERVLGDSG